MCSRSICQIPIQIGSLVEGRIWWLCGCRGPLIGDFWLIGLASVHSLLNNYHQSIQVVTVSIRYTRF